MGDFEGLERISGGDGPESRYKCLKCRTEFDTDACTHENLDLKMSAKWGREVLVPACPACKVLLLMTQVSEREAEILVLKENLFDSRTRFAHADNKNVLEIRTLKTALRELRSFLYDDLFVKGGVTGPGVWNENADAMSCPKWAERIDVLLGERSVCTFCKGTGQMPMNANGRIYSCPECRPYTDYSGVEKRILEATYGGSPVKRSYNVWRSLMDIRPSGAPISPTGRKPERVDQDRACSTCKTERTAALCERCATPLCYDCAQSIDRRGTDSDGNPIVDEAEYVCKNCKELQEKQNTALRDLDYENATKYGDVIKARRPQVCHYFHNCPCGKNHQAELLEAKAIERFRLLAGRPEIQSKADLTPMEREALAGVVRVGSDFELREVSLTADGPALGGALRVAGVDMGSGPDASVTVIARIDEKGKTFVIDSIERSCAKCGGAKEICVSCAGPRTVRGCEDVAGALEHPALQPCPTCQPVNFTAWEKLCEEDEPKLQPEVNVTYTFPIMGEETGQGTVELLPWEDAVQLYRVYRAFCDVRRSIPTMKALAEKGGFSVKERLQLSEGYDCMTGRLLTVHQRAVVMMTPGEGEEKP